MGTVPASNRKVPAAGDSHPPGIPGPTTTVFVFPHTGPAERVRKTAPADAVRKGRYFISG
jgi:hypothetical protein